MQRLKPDVDIVLDVLHAVLQVQPTSNFVVSLHRQYTERGGLSKKQLQGLLSKASKISEVSQSKLATLEAIILKKHEKTKSELPVNTPFFEHDSASEESIDAILQKYPEHKRVLFFKAKVDSKQLLTPVEKAELNKFYKLFK